MKLSFDGEQVQIVGECKVILMPKVHPCVDNSIDIQKSKCVVGIKIGIIGSLWKNTN